MTTDAASHSRRDFLLGTTAVGTAAVFPRTTLVAGRRSRGPVVLVHGAWHGGWCWRRVVDRLNIRGRYVTAPTLSGVGERSHLAADGITLSTQIADIVHDITWKDLDEVVLVGHSFGGMVITGVAEQLHDRIAAIVYLDAFIPADGQSLATMRAPGARPFAAPLVAPPPASYFNVNARDRAWVDSKLTPHPTACFTDPLHVTEAYRAIPHKVYLRSTQFAQPAFDAAYTRWQADREWKTYKLDSGHDVMIDRPDAIASIVDSLG
jgi:pimeloyl-ACP methyl ester carboxylesterase